MFLQGALYVSFYLFTAFIAIALPPNPSVADGHLPNITLPRDTTTSCTSPPNTPSSCFITYCWTDNDDQTSYQENMEIVWGQDTMKSNPKNVATFDSNLTLDPNYNTGYNGWFPRGHECSNTNTMIYTDSRLSIGYATVYLCGLMCNNCQIGGVGAIGGESSPLAHNLYVVNALLQNGSVGQDLSGGEVAKCVGS
jgi:hypothetical protein